LGFHAIAPADFRSSMAVQVSVFAVAGKMYFLLALQLIHVLSAAALFGAMFYSIMIIQPKSRKYFSDQQFEEFIAFISNGARWKMLIGLASIALSGFLLIPFHRDSPGKLWTILILSKIVVLIITVTLFCYVSWRLWPARIFATPEEIPRFQRLFRKVGFAMLTLVTIEFILGIIAHAC
jgi:uncharacterized membrane protein